MQNRVRLLPEAQPETYLATSFRKPIWSSVGGATQSETSKIIVRLWSYCSSPLRRASLRPRRRAAEPTAAAPTAAGRASAASQQPRSTQLNSTQLNSTQLNSCLLLQASSARPRLGLRRYRAFVRPGICSAPSLSSASALAPPAAAANILPTSASARHQLSRASAAASASASAQLCSLCHLSHESRPVQACPARSALRQAALGSGLGVHARPRPSR